MRAIVYVDGFNLYFRRLKDTPYKWLDLQALSGLLLPNFDIQRVRYFTARVVARRNDPQQVQRQQAYLGALRAIGVNEHFGNYLSRPKMRPTVESIKKGHPQFVEIMNEEEKGSDVNLAAYLLRDGYKDLYDTAMVVSNDSDLRTPIRMVMRELHKEVIVAITDPTVRKSALPASSYRRIRAGALAVAQLPQSVTDQTGKTFTKPAGW